MSRRRLGSSEMPSWGHRAVSVGGHRFEDTKGLLGRSEFSTSGQEPSLVPHQEILDSANPPSSSLPPHLTSAGQCMQEHLHLSDQIPLPWDMLYVGQVFFLHQPRVQQQQEEDQQVGDLVFVEMQVAEEAGDHGQHVLGLNDFCSSIVTPSMSRTVTNTSFASHYSLSILTHLHMGGQGEGVHTGQ